MDRPGPYRPPSAAGLAAVAGSSSNAPDDDRAPTPASHAHNHDNDQDAEGLVEDDESDLLDHPYQAEEAPAPSQPAPTPVVPAVSPDLPSTTPEPMATNPSAPLPLPLLLTPVITANAAQAGGATTGITHIVRRMAIEDMPDVHPDDWGSAPDPGPGMMWVRKSLYRSATAKEFARRCGITDWPPPAEKNRQWLPNCPQSSEYLFSFRYKRVPIGQPPPPPPPPAPVPVRARAQSADSTTSESSTDTDTSTSSSSSSSSASSSTSPPLQGASASASSTPFAASTAFDNTASSSATAPPPPPQGGSHIDTSTSLPPAGEPSSATSAKKRTRNSAENPAPKPPQVGTDADPQTSPSIPPVPQRRRTLPPKAPELAAATTVTSTSQGVQFAHGPLSAIGVVSHVGFMSSGMADGGASIGAVGVPLGSGIVAGQDAFGIQQGQQQGHQVQGHHDVEGDLAQEHDLEDHQFGMQGPVLGHGHGHGVHGQIEEQLLPTGEAEAAKDKDEEVQNEPMGPMQGAEGH